MENINPLLNSIIDIRYRINAGESIRSSINTHILSQPSEWSTFLRRWLISIEHKEKFKSILGELQNPYRRAFLEILESGLAGATISQALTDLEGEVRQACDLELDIKLKRLPILALLPVTLLMFPAFLLLLFGPTLSHLIEELSK